MGPWPSAREPSVPCAIYRCAKDHLETVSVISTRFVVCVNTLTCSGPYCKDYVFMKVKGLELLLDDGPCFVFIGCLVLAINVIRG